MGRGRGEEGVVGGEEVGEGGVGISGGVILLLWRRTSAAGQVDQYEALGRRS
jgi:hypothetical protein